MPFELLPGATLELRLLFHLLPTMPRHTDAAELGGGSPLWWNLDGASNATTDFAIKRYAGWLARHRPGPTGPQAPRRTLRAIPDADRRPPSGPDYCCAVGGGAHALEVTLTRTCDVSRCVWIKRPDGLGTYLEQLPGSSRLEGALARITRTVPGAGRKIPQEIARLTGCALSHRSSVFTQAPRSPRLLPAAPVNAHCGRSAQTNLFYQASRANRSPGSPVLPFSQFTSVYARRGRPAPARRPYHS